jgi:hypothetical protein
MKGKALSVVVVLLALSCARQVENLNQPEDDSPPGYADVVITDHATKPNEVDISIQSVEDPAGGMIRCGRSANDKCKGHSRITWSVQNNSKYDRVEITMTNFKIGETATNPFNQDPGKNNIGKNDRVPVFKNVKGSPTSGSYKYDIVVKDDKGKQIGSKDPRIDI